MHLRRALLLFAIVLGLAAIAASVSRPLEQREPEQAGRQPSGATEPDTTPTVSAGTAAPPPVEVVFSAEEEQTRRIETGQAATLLVEVDEPGQVTIPDLGLLAYGEPLTPARFDVLESTPGRHEIEFMPAAGDETDLAGSLVVEPPEE